MMERRHQPQQQQQTVRVDAPSKIDALYSWLSYDLQRIRGELLKELKYSSVQMGSLYQEMQKDKEGSARAITQEIRYSYKQNQTIYDGLAKMLTEDVSGRITSLDEKLSSIQETRALNEELANLLNGGVASKLEKLEQMETLLVKVDEAIAALPVDGVDYTRIAEEVGDRILELFNDAKEAQNEAVKALLPEVDYDRIIGGVTEKVVESLPYSEKVDYRHIEKLVKENSELITEDKISAIADAVAGKVVVPVPEIDYNRLADMVAARISVPQPVIDYDLLAVKVAEKLAENTQQDYDVILDDEGVDHIASKVVDKLLNVMPTQVCEEQAIAQEPTYEAEVQEEIAEAVKETVVEPVEEAVEAVVEEIIVEEVAEATETVEIVEEATAEAPASASDELAVSFNFEEVNNELVDAETGLVIRLKKSFTAKIRQSDEKVKAYYSDLKNELTSYKKINSNVSWHGDRFNFGRDTVAKINILGKTLCFYLALDPNDPEYKTTIYHQKDVSAQKAYESTPFMVKIKSDAAAKKALRLVGYLAEKVGTEKKEDFEAVDYVEEFAYQSTKQLYDDGFIKATKEKKVDLDF